MPAAGGGYLILGRYVEAQGGHNDFQAKPERSRIFFIIITGEEGTVLCVRPGSHLLLSYGKDKLIELFDILNIEDISVPPISLFIGHGKLQHVGAE